MHTPIMPASEEYIQYELCRNTSKIPVIVKGITTLYTVENKNHLFEKWNINRRSDSGIQERKAS